MAKHVITGWLYYQPASKYSESGEPTISLLPFPPEHAGKTWGVGVREHSVEVEIPDDFDPRPLQVAALDKEIAAVRAEFTARINQLQEQKSRLLCIENTVDAA
jgi:hypothetical protein